MKAALLVLGSWGLLVQPRPAGPTLPAPGPDAVGQKPALLRGETTPKAILANRAAFRDHLARVKLPADLRIRWQAARQPFTLVAVFGSWCADSHRHLPDLLALEATPNPFIEVHYLGVARDKGVPRWPKGCPPQPVERVPTFYLFTRSPGGAMHWVGSVVEAPPEGQTMAAALVDLVESGARRP